MLKRKIYRILQSLRWYSQFFLCKITGNFNKNVKRLPEDAFIEPLILVPHSDDEWIGPYSILNKAAKQTTCVFFNLYGNDYSEANKALRNSEIQMSSKLWGFRLVNNFNFNPETLAEDIIKHTNIFIPSPYDWHPEHRKVFQTLYHALKLLPKTEAAEKRIYYYCVSVPHRIHEAVYYAPLSKNDINNKWNNFCKIYHSQSFMPALRYKLNLRLVPSECGYAAQFYIYANIKRIRCDYDLSLDESFTKRADNLINRINNIYDIRKDS